MDCKRGCCWSPFQVCARKHECACHSGAVQVQDKLSLSELLKAQAVSRGHWA